MQFKMSSAVAIKADDVAAATAFYTDVLGFPLDEDGPTQGIDAAPLTLYVDPRQVCEGMLLELLVPDVEAARVLLEANGCTVVHWGGVGKACVIRDPYGVAYNLWQER